MIMLDVALKGGNGGGLGTNDSSITVVGNEWSSMIFGVTSTLGIGVTTSEGGAIGAGRGARIVLVYVSPLSTSIWANLFPYGTLSSCLLRSLIVSALILSSSAIISFMVAASVFKELLILFKGSNSEEPMSVALECLRNSKSMGSDTT